MGDSRQDTYSDDAALYHYDPLNPGTEQRGSADSMPKPAEDSMLARVQNAFAATQPFEDGLNVHSYIHGLVDGEGHYIVVAPPNTDMQFALRMLGFNPNDIGIPLAIVPEMALLGLPSPASAPIDPHLSRAVISEKAMHAVLKL